MDENIEKIHEVLAGRIHASCLYTASVLNLADIMHEGVNDIQSISNQCSAQPDFLYRLLRALSSIDIFIESEKSLSFRNSDLSEYLRSSHPQSIKPLVEMCCAPWHWNTWSGLDYTIKTGRPYFDKLHNKDFYKFMRDEENVANQFNDAMSSLSSLSNEKIAKLYKFSGNDRVIDIGGGDGGLLSAIVKNNNIKSSALFDLSSAIASAELRFKTEGLDSKCKLIPGDFFSDKIPKNYDKYILKHVLHGLSEDDSIKLLSRIRDAMSRTSRLLVIDMLIPNTSDYMYSKFNDIQMMLLSPHGCERTKQQFDEIFCKSSLQLTKLEHVQMGIHIMELAIE